MHLDPLILISWFSQDHATGLDTGEHLCASTQGARCHLVVQSCGMAQHCKYTVRRSRCNANSL